MRLFALLIALAPMSTARAGSRSGSAPRPTGTPKRRAASLAWFSDIRDRRRCNE